MTDMNLLTEHSKKIAAADAAYGDRMTAATSAYATATAAAHAALKAAEEAFALERKEALADLAVSKTEASAELQTGLEARKARMIAALEQVEEAFHNGEPEPERKQDEPERKEPVITTHLPGTPQALDAQRRADEEFGGAAPADNATKANGDEQGRTSL